MTTETEISPLTEVLARAWIDCDPNRAGSEPGSGFHPDDIQEPYENSDGTTTTTGLTGKPHWRWFIPRAEKLESYLAERGYKLVKAGQ
jgi:hypothetical protein